MTTHTGPWYCFRCRSRLREPAGTGPAGTPIWRCRACGCYEWRRDRVVVPTPAEVFERLEACRTDGQRTELAQGLGITMYHVRTAAGMRLQFSRSYTALEAAEAAYARQTRRNDAAADKRCVRMRAFEPDGTVAQIRHNMPHNKPHGA